MPDVEITTLGAVMATTLKGQGLGKPSTQNKAMTASVTVADGDQVVPVAIAATPAAGSYVAVLVNGSRVIVGDGTKIGADAYFSGDAGTTARALSAIVSGDTCHWNGSIAGYQLAATDRVDFDYEE